ncbi:MAG TPA: FMN-binding negative transcriptional regulator [Pelobium sp.]|nr:FMN-binding negative transcriptional regulator [Pelobium sp.]
MYIPSANAMNDRDEIVNFMKRFSFATIVSTDGTTPLATHLPFIVDYKNDKLLLTSHFAKANDHWKYMEHQNVLVIFSEPHAYISTAHYDKELNVPTWNYLSVHVYGTVELISDYQRNISLLEKTIENYEPSFALKWNEFPEDYKIKMVKGIVGFEMTVNDIQAKKKLSQNRTPTEKANIITALSKSKDNNENLIAEYMKKDFI